METPLIEGLAWLTEYLPTARPRIVEVGRADAPVVVFTDGAAEAEGVTVGGVIFAMGSPPEFFGEQVPEELVTEWRKQGGFQAIGQAELLPIKMAAKVWSDRRQGVLVYLVSGPGRGQARNGQGLFPGRKEQRYHRSCGAVHGSCKYEALVGEGGNRV